MDLSCTFVQVNTCGTLDMHFTSKLITRTCWVDQQTYVTHHTNEVITNACLLSNGNVIIAASHLYNRNYKHYLDLLLTMVPIKLGNYKGTTIRLLVSHQFPMEEYKRTCNYRINFISHIKVVQLTNKCIKCTKTQSYLAMLHTVHIYS